jgi:amidase
MGAQLLGHDGDEATLVSLAAQLEAAEGWTTRRPPI